MGVGPKPKSDEQLLKELEDAACALGELERKILQRLDKLGSAELNWLVDYYRGLAKEMVMVTNQKRLQHAEVTKTKLLKEFEKKTL